MKILFTGKSDFTYNRTRILLKGLKAHPDVEVTEYPINAPDFDQKEFDALLLDTDYVYVPPFRHSDVRGIRKKTNKPLIFDPLISKYLTRTIDHGKWWTAPEKYFRDWVAFRNSDVIVMDTQCDKDYIIEKFRLDPQNIFVVPIGVNTSGFMPLQRDEVHSFKVGFHGGFIPLQGVSKIVAAAALLKDEPELQVEIIGTGPQYRRITGMVKRQGLENITFHGWVDYDKLNAYVNSFDICLGIFGDSIKTDFVIPNKVFEYAGARKCIISKDTPGIRELFTHDENIMLCSNEPEAMAEAIVNLRKNRDKREQLASAAYDLMVGQYNEERIGQMFYEEVKKWEGR